MQVLKCINTPMHVQIYQCTQTTDDTVPNDYSKIPAGGSLHCNFQWLQLLEDFTSEHIKPAQHISK